MKCLIVDDESLARSRLKVILSDMSVHFTMKEASNGQAALKKCKSFEPDLVFLDIRMPGMSGINVAHELVKLKNTPKVIFTTAYGEFALEAFDANAVDYLLKPIRRERLETALEKIITWDKSTAKGDESFRKRKNFALKEKGKIRLVPLEQVIFFRADEKFVQLRTVDGEFQVAEVLNNLEQELEDQFIRIHRNALISKAQIKSLEKNPSTGKWRVHFKNIDDMLEVSRRQTANIRQWFKKKS